MKKELELYVHIPFCVKKCAYCDFLSFSAKQEEVSAYVEALAEEIKGKKEQFSDYCVTTIFLGGGTPSILEGVYTASIFRALRESFDIAENAENNDGSKSRNCVGRKDKHVENMRSEPVKYRSSIGR